MKKTIFVFIAGLLLAAGNLYAETEVSALYKKMEKADC